MRRSMCLIILILWILPAAGQQALRVEVRLVNVYATVTDSAGRYVGGLQKEDFILEEDGVPQEIAHFSQDENIPISVGILFDSSGSMLNKLRTAVTAVDRFIRAIHPDDDIFLMSFANGTELQQDFTADRDKLSKALRKINAVGGTRLFDALNEALVKIRAGRHEKRAILLISDGDDTGGKVRLPQIQQAVRESELLIYPLAVSAVTYAGGVDHVPFNWPPPLSGSPRGAITRRRDAVDLNVMQSLADLTGGRAFLLTDSVLGRTNEIEKVLDKIDEELRSQYTLAFYPAHADDGRFHALKVRTRSGLAARSRTGYTSR